MEFAKQFIPEAVLKLLRPLYHGTIALAASIYFGRPSEKLVVVGITGTAGKSTTAAMLSHILNSAGKKCGYMTTVNFFDGQTDFINKHGLSMPGGWLLQKQLRRLADNGCEYAVIECTSEGLAQNRHLGINFDAAIFTNLTRAHIAAHGSFGNYRAAKARLFSVLRHSGSKSFFPSKTIVVNLDDPMAGFYLSFPADQKFGLSFNGIKTHAAQKVFFAKVLNNAPTNEFELDGIKFSLNMPGEFNIKNAGLAAASAAALGVPLAVAAAALQNFHGVRGRMEFVPNNLGFEVIVDYGCEPASFKSALEAAAQLPHNSLIHVFGSTGGHRDTAKQFEFGQTSAQFADNIIITNDDVYDSDPLAIAQNIEQGVDSFKLRRPRHQIILERRKAIARALALAQQGDLVLLTGKGSEQFLVLPGNKRIDWDEVAVVKEELAKIHYS